MKCHSKHSIIKSLCFSAFAVFVIFIKLITRHKHWWTFCVFDSSFLFSRLQQSNGYGAKCQQKNIIFSLWSDWLSDWSRKMNCCQNIGSLHFLIGILSLHQANSLNSHQCVINRLGFFYRSRIYLYTNIVSLSLKYLFFVLFCFALFYRYYL